MGKIIHFPRHARALSLIGIKKASILTRPRDISLNRLAKPKDGSFRPAKMLRKCGSEQFADSASSLMVIPLSSNHRSIGCCSDITEDIPPGNDRSQTKRFLWEMSLEIKRLLECDMKKRTKDETPHIFLGDWLDEFEIGRTEAAEIAGCDQPYISNICANRKHNVNVLILLRISEYMNVNINDFYHPLPDRSAVGALKRLSPRAQKTLLALYQKKA